MAHLRWGKVLRQVDRLYAEGTSTGCSDSQLLSRFTSARDESELAFEAIVQRHGPMVLEVCRRLLRGDRHAAEDALQATFLVLARRAGSIALRPNGSLGPWLHEVACRTAAKARVTTVRRVLREQRAGDQRMSDCVESDGAHYDDDDYRVLHEEVARLPEKYRSAVVLCYFEGLTHDEAARSLRWPVGTVRGYLARARDLLRARLVRRGVTSAVTVVVLGSRAALATALNPELLCSVGRAVSGAFITTRVVALADTTLRALLRARIRQAALVLCVAAAVGTTGLGVMGYSATRRENPRRAANPGRRDLQSVPQTAAAPRAGHPGQEGRPALAAAQVAQAPPRPAATKPAANQGPVTMRVEVVDPEGHPLPGADVAMLLWYSRGSGKNERVNERTKTDNAGHAQVEVARERMGAKPDSATVWAYQAGRAFATSDIVFFTANSAPDLVHLTLGQPAKWTITVLSPDDRPVAGLRLTPRLLQSTRRPPTLSVPDGLFEPLTATTDAKGAATLPHIPSTMVPLSIRISGPGVAPHTLPLDTSRGKDVVLKLGRPGRVVGVVRTASGAPLANVPVELWVRGSGDLPAGVQKDFGDRRVTSDEAVRLDAQPLKTGPQGAFQTSPILLNGSSYRVSIRHDGFVSFVSDWVTLTGERAAIPAIRLQPLQQLTGRIHDRQGRPVAGTRVFVPAGGPATTTDAQGRFTLVGISPGKAVVLAEQAGFHLQGRLVDPSQHADLGTLTLVRTRETPGPAMAPLTDPISLDESRALADRLLEPYLREPREGGDDGARLEAIESLGEYDVNRALELLQDGKFRGPDRHRLFVRGLLLAKLAQKDPALAEAMVESITPPALKVSPLIGVAKALPASERARKLAMLDRAFTLVKDRPQAQPGRIPPWVAEIAEQWLDMGERERARRVIELGKTWETARNPADTRFLAQLARLDPQPAIARLQRVPGGSSPRDRSHEPVYVALRLATDHPAEAEQVFNLRQAGGTDGLLVFDVLRLCRRLARVDPPRARRVAASHGSRGIRACAWASVAVGMADRDKAGASEALDRAIEEIDRLRESGPGLELVFFLNGIRLMPPTNPAAQILPIVERVAPERLADVFWRAVALHPRIETDREDQLQSSYISYECTLLARYDRDVAAALFEPMDSYLKTPAARQASIVVLNTALMVKGCLDPRGAAALIESLTPPGDFNPSNPAYQARRRLAERLGRPPEIRWRELWRSMGAQLDD